jgi:hypothetical protein
VGPGKFLLRKAPRVAEGSVSSCEGKPGGRPSRPSFWVPLRSPVPVLDSCPIALSTEIGDVVDGIRSGGLCYFPLILALAPGDGR